MISNETTCDVGSITVAVSLSYTEIDPTCVVFSFRIPGSDEDINWAFHRDLLKEALDSGTSGAGDVKFFVDRHDGYVRMELSSPDGEASAYFAIEIIQDFADSIFEAVKDDSYTPTDEDIYKWLSPDDTM